MMQIFCQFLYLIINWVKHWRATISILCKISPGEDFHRDLQNVAVVTVVKSLKISPVFKFHPGAISNPGSNRSNLTPTHGPQLTEEASYLDLWRIFLRLRFNLENEY